MVSWSEAETGTPIEVLSSASAPARQLLERFPIKHRIQRRLGRRI